jgi:hypothetical protein
VHPFWSSHEEKQACVRLSPGGGHGRSWSSVAGHGELAGEGKDGEGEEGEGGGGLGCSWGGVGGPWGGAARSSSAPAVFMFCLLYDCCP